MADQNIRFRHAGDTGQRDDIEAIEPYNDGEPAQQTVFRRPPENLRYRSEILRTEGEDSKYLHDTDKGWRIVNANTLGENPGNPLPFVTWNPDGYAPGEGTFAISAEIVVQPMDTPAVDSKETKVYEFPTGGPTAATVEFTAELFAYEGMNYRRIIWQAKDSSEIPNNYCLIEVTGGGTELNTVTITVRDDWQTSVADVDAQIIAEAANLLLAGFTGVTTGVGSTKVDALPADDDYTMERTWERQLHHILPGDLTSFFGSHGLSDGDTLAIFYEWMVEDGGDGGRRQSTPTSGAAPPNTAAGTRLFITSEEPWKIPLSIPLCKRSGDDLFFIDGTVITSPQEGTVHFGEHGYTINSINDAIVTVGTQWANSEYLDDKGAPPYEYTIEDALNYIIGDLASIGGLPLSSGAHKIGLDGFPILIAPSVDPLPWSSGGILRDYLYTVFQYVNRKGSLAADETVTGEWTFSDKATFNAEVELASTVTHLNTSTDEREAFGDTDFHLVYNSTGGLTTWNTLNIYEAQLPGTQGGHIWVFGATYNNSTGDFDAAPDDTGAGKISAIAHLSSGIFNMVSNTFLGPGPTGLSPLSSTGWPVWNRVASSGNIFYTDTGNINKFDGAGSSEFDQDVEFKADTTFISTVDNEGSLWMPEWVGVEESVCFTSGSFNPQGITDNVALGPSLGFKMESLADQSYFSRRLPAAAVSGENIVVESFFRLANAETANWNIYAELELDALSMGDSTPSANVTRQVAHDILSNTAQYTIHRVRFVAPGTNINALDIIKCKIRLYDVSSGDAVYPVHYLGSTVKYRTERIADVWSSWPPEG